MNRPILTLVIFLIVITNKFYSQTGDSVKVYNYGEIVIAADRFESPLHSSTSSVSKFDAQTMKRLPINSSIELFKYVPGFNVTSTTGLFSSPIINVRGFNGGGEAEYMAVFIDNIQINDVETGLIDWSLLSNSFVNNIELVKGGSSSLYGDFAMGGVIDIHTFSEEINKTKISLGGGSFNSLKFNLFSSYFFSGGQFNLFGNYFKSDGFRDHNKSKSYSFGGNILYDINSKSRIRFNTVNNFNIDEIPGSLPILKNIDHSSSLPFFKFDENDADKIRFSLGYDYILDKNNKFVVDVNYYNKSASAIRTFTNNTPIIDPSTFQPIGIFDTTLYGDTKNSKIYSDVIYGKLNYLTKLPNLDSKAIIGVDYQTSSYGNSTFDLQNGFEMDYNNYAEYEKERIVSGTGDRNKFASFINLKSEISDKLFLSIGLRYDFMVDKYNGSLPDTSITINNEAFSPKIGLSYNYSVSEKYSGTFYGNFNRAFKAPTVDQLLDFDELNFGIFIPISQSDFIFQNIKASPFGNPLLKPQISTNYEIGSHQSLKVSEEASIELSGAFYFSKIKNEIDFDIQSFRYNNISDSRHMGFELGLLTKIQSFNSFFNYSFTEAESLAEEKKGFQLKGIPKNVINFGISYLLDFGIDLSLAAHSNHGAFLDDINENQIPDHIIWDGKIRYNYHSFGLNVLVSNLFNKKYYSLGYSLDNINYFYPMAGRNIFVEIDWELF